MADLFAEAAASPTPMTVTLPNQGSLTFTPGGQPVYSPPPFVQAFLSATKNHSAPPHAWLPHAGLNVSFDYMRMAAAFKTHAEQKHIIPVV